MRRTFKIAMGVFALGLALYAASPLWAGWQLRQAMRSRDVAALEERVNWPVLRANLKPRVATAIQENAAQSGVIGSMIKKTLGSVLTNTAVDTLVTPGNLSRILAGRAFMIERLPGAGKSADTKPPVASNDEEPEDADDPMPPRRLQKAVFESLTRFRVEASHPRLPGNRILATLALEGFSWKLVDIDIAKR